LLFFSMGIYAIMRIEEIVKLLRLLVLKTF